MSIRTRMLLATNLLVAAIGLVVGWLGIEVAGHEIERKLVDESVVEAAALIQQMKLPRSSDSLMERVGQILGAETAIGPVNRSEIIAASLPADERRELLAQIHDGPLPRNVTLGGKAFRMAAAAVPPPVGTTDPERMQLYLLVPHERVMSDKGGVARTMALLALAAIAVATVIAFWISQTITRPIRRLAGRMERLSKAAAEIDLHALLPGQGAAEPAGEGRGQPREIARLTEAYDRLLAQLAEARTRLAESARMATLGQLSASVAHELRNPLSGIKMNARVLSDELARLGVSDESIGMILREIDRMDVYLQELLSLAAADGSSQSPDAAAAPGHVSTVQLDELADSVVSLLTGRLRQSSITVERTFDPQALAAQADGGRIRQVILNLLLNAVEAAGPGGRIRLGTDPADGGRVRFFVADSGKGVAVPEGVDIFKPFVSGKDGGTGLGLHICRRIIEQHGGEIGYDSSPRGSTFWFLLPGVDL